MVTHSERRSIALVLALMLAACVGSDPQVDGDDLSDDESPAGADDSDDDDDDDDDDDRPSGDDDDDDDAPDAGRSPGGDGAAMRDGGSGGRDASAGRADAAMSPPEAGARGDGGNLTGRDATAPAAGDAGSTASATDVPPGEHCAPVASWDAQAAQFEQQVLELTNMARAVGHNCDAEGMFGPAPPLKMEARLRCASRLHSKYMAEKMEFAHTQSATGLDPFKRMQAAGYQFRQAGENIAYGQRTPQEGVSGWLDSDGHCANIMNPRFTELGVGYFASAPAMSTRPGGGRAMPYWTQNFGTPR